MMTIFQSTLNARIRMKLKVPPGCRPEVAGEGHSLQARTKKLFLVVAVIRNPSLVGESPCPWRMISVSLQISSRVGYAGAGTGCRGFQCCAEMC
jgi:hypothetical protein